MKLIEGWRKFYKYWSIQLGAAGVVVTSVLISSPTIAIEAWTALPSDLKSFIPPNYMPFIGVGIFVLSMIAKFIVQSKLHTGTTKNDNA